MTNRPETPPVIPSPETAAEQFEYRLLTSHLRTDGTRKTTDELHRQYVHLTDRLIHQITEGINVVNPATGEMEKRRPDYLVFLDKSARPVQWLMSELWPILAADADGIVPEMPKSVFTNIDREQWVNVVDEEGVGGVDISKVDQSIIRSLRSLFVDPKLKRTEQDKKNGLGEYIDTAPTLLDDATVLIIDEVHSTGRTLRIAEKFFERAFPGARIATTHWMGGVATRGVLAGNADLPVWYSDRSPLGRGVGDRGMYEEGSPSITQILGRYFLSTRLRPEDIESSHRLRAELHQLAVDVADHKVVVVPSHAREDEDFDERVERFNGMDLKQFAHWTKTHRSS